jgi:hypothetical protein
LLDLLDPWFTVLRFGDNVDTSGMERALNAAGVPFGVIDLEADEPARDVYEGFDAFLIRPDAHVAWRGKRTPDDPERIVRVSIGHVSPFALPLSCSHC